MRQRHLGLNPRKSVFLEWQGRKEWRSKGKWMDRRSDVVPKTPQGKLLSPTSAANFITPLKDQSRKTMLRDPDCGSQPVGTRSHYHSIIFISLLHVWLFSIECPTAEIAQNISRFVPTDPPYRVRYTSSGTPRRELSRYNLVKTGCDQKRGAQAARPASEKKNGESSNATAA